MISGDLDLHTRLFDACHRFSSAPRCRLAVPCRPDGTPLFLSVSSFVSLPPFASAPSLLPPLYITAHFDSRCRAVSFPQFICLSLFLSSLALAVSFSLCHLLLVLLNLSFLIVPIPRSLSPPQTEVPPCSFFSLTAAGH